MTDESKDIDEHSGVETTGHSWDGIKELNNPLPRWWLFVWYMSIAWAIVYMILMPAIPALPGLGTNTKGLRGHSDRVEVAKAVSELKTARDAQSIVLLDAGLEKIETDRTLQQFALAMGESAFGDNCATCHGAGGRGAIGYPALADDVWLWDGSLDGIEYTIRHGIRHDTDDGTRFSAMPAFGRDGLLKRSEVDGTQGAPNLTDAEWLYGDREADIEATIYNARNSHMPAWDDRLDDATIKAIAVYVHSLGGGE